MTTGVGLAWLISFAACFLLSRSIMSRRDFLWVWWNFAFLPVPPRSLADASLLGESIANVFINPASILTPMNLAYTAALASIVTLADVYRWVNVGRADSFCCYRLSFLHSQHPGFINIHFMADCCSVSSPPICCSWPRAWQPSAATRVGF